MKSLLLLPTIVLLASEASGQNTVEMQNRCEARPAITEMAAQTSWNGWGADTSNTRYKDEAISPARLKLKWAFGFPGAKAVSGQPAVFGGRVFVSADTGDLYSLDAATGCVYWSFHAEAAVRSSVTAGPRAAGGYAVYFGDAKTNVFALDASNGQLIWKVHVEDHPAARITGAPKLFEGRLYVPVASGEEGAGGDPNYACCTF